MKIKYTPQADILLIEFSDAAIAESDEIQPGIILDLDANGKPVRLEILKASENTSSPQLMAYEVVNTPQ